MSEVLDDNLEKEENSNGFQLDFEEITPWNGANDTGKDVRMKWLRNFEKIRQNFELLSGLWSLKIDSDGKKYAYTNFPIVGAAGMTMFAGEEIKVDSIFKGLPIDTETLQWVDGVLTVVGGTGGGEAGFVKWQNIEGKPSWITSEKPKYSYTEITGLTEELEKYVTLSTDQSITGMKDFTDGMKVSGVLFKVINGVLTLDCSIAVTGGITTHAIGEQTTATIMDGIAVDGTTITKENGVLKVVGGGGASNWDELEGKPSWITDTKPTYAWGEIAQKPATLSGYGIQASDVLNTIKSVDGSGSGLDADTLDGSHRKNGKNGVPTIIKFPIYTEISPSASTDDYLNKIPGWTYNNLNTNEDDTLLLGIGHPNSRGCMLMHIYSKEVINSEGYPRYSSGLYIPLGNTSPYIFGTNDYVYYQNRIAFITSNVASATKLQTARTIWGQSFDGTANVTGSLTSVIDITGTGTFTGANIKATDSIYLNGIRLHKTAEGVITLEGNLAVTGGITQFAVNEVSSSTIMDGVVVDGTSIKKENGVLKVINAGGGEAGSVKWANIDGKPTTLAGYSITASDVLSTLKTVDGSGSGLDSDLLGGYYSTSYDLSIDLGNCGDFGWYVIGILQITDYTLTGNHANGRLGFFRENGNNPIQQIQYSMSTKYNSTDVRLSYIILGQKIVYPCTFTYNGKKWAGFVVRWSAGYSKSIKCTRFGGRVSEKSTPFLLKYYTSNTSTINNSEVYNSIQINGTDIVDDSVSSGTFYCDSLQSNNDIYIDGIRLYKNNNRLSINSDLSVTNEIRFSLTSYTTEYEGGRIIATDSENLYLQGGDSGTIWITSRNAKVLSSLEIKANNFNINGNKIWHAGNDGSGSGMDADLLDGFHRGNSVNNIPTLINFPDFSTISPSASTDDYIDKVLGWAYNNCNAGNKTVLLGCGRPNSIGNILMQLYGDDDINSEGYPKYSSAILIALNANPRYFGTNDYKFYSKTFAFITDNVASATKLQTARTIWGQSFDGTANVSGSLTGVTNITMSGALTVPYSGGQWISMATRSNIIQANQNQTQSSAHALFRVKSYSGNAVCFGGLGNEVGFYGFYKSRIDSGSNDIDWYTKWNTSDGTLTHKGNLLVTGGGTFYSSDIRAKNVIESLKIKLNDIANAPVIKFKWNGYNDLKDDGKLHIGGIAQYIEKILPECVIGQKDDFLSFDYATTGYVFSVLTARHLLSYETRTDRIIRKLKERIRRLERQLNIENHEEVCIVAD